MTALAAKPLAPVSDSEPSGGGRGPLTTDFPNTHTGCHLMSGLGCAPREQSRFPRYQADVRRSASADPESRSERSARQIGADFHPGNPAIAKCDWLDAPHRIPLGKW